MQEELGGKDPVPTPQTNAQVYGTQLTFIYLSFEQ